MGRTIKAGKSSPNVAIVDYGLGNLFSVKQACEHVGINAVITGAGDQLTTADAIVLPGVGAFGDAMRALHERDLLDPLHRVIAAGKPLLGICLGMQLLMTQSDEFGTNPGLGVIEGTVRRFGPADGANGAALKVPQVGWNRVNQRHPGSPGGTDTESVFAGIDDGAYMYFVHSYYTCPADPQVVATTTRYGGIEFCSSLQLGNIFACQFHPERSGVDGLKIYANIRKILFS